MSLNVADKSWELIDPNPNIFCLFNEFNKAYFYGVLAMCEVKWSSKMTLCAGQCHYEGNGGLCSIRLSLPLLKLRPRKDLVETLLHEMIHAYLFVTENNRDHNGHGPQFLSHMYRINKLAGCNITVYHNFHAEVDVYRTHWWRCDGPCRDRKPFYGWVKRANNRAPGTYDFWWNDHLRDCGGNFIKVREPDNYRQKTVRKRKLSDSAALETSNDCNGMSAFVPFSGVGYKLSGSDSNGLNQSGRSVTDQGELRQRLLDEFVQVKSSFPSKVESRKFSIKAEEGKDTQCCICPSCGQQLLIDYINEHLDMCVM